MQMLSHPLLENHKEALQTTSSMACRSTSLTAANRGADLLTVYFIKHTSASEPDVLLSRLTPEPSHSNFLDGMWFSIVVKRYGLQCAQLH